MTPEQIEQFRKTWSSVDITHVDEICDLALEALAYREQMARVGETRRASYPLLEGKA